MDTGFWFLLVTSTRQTCQTRSITVRIKYRQKWRGLNATNVPAFKLITIGKEDLHLEWCVNKRIPREVCERDSSIDVRQWETRWCSAITDTNRWETDVGEQLTTSKDNERVDMTRKMTSECAAYESTFFSKLQIYWTRTIPVIYSLDCF
jgi:hypothetical protein